MKITFDAVPICSDKITGIGWCEVGQTQAFARMYPDISCEYSFFTSGDNERIDRVSNFAGGNIGMNISGFSGYLYRAASTFLPVPYSWFFGSKSDITHFFNYIIPPFVHGKKVVTVHDMVYKAFPETVRGRTRFMLEIGLKRSMKRADIIITDSEFSKSEIVKYFPQHEKKIRVVPCGVDLERFHPCTKPERIPEVKRSLEIEGDYFLYLGTIEPRKNLERLIAAYGHLAEKLGEKCPKLVMAGGKGWLNDGRPESADVRSAGICVPVHIRGIRYAAAGGYGLRSSRTCIGRGFTSRSYGRLCDDMRRLLREKHRKGTLSP